jgi:hypothetical protein
VNERGFNRDAIASHKGENINGRNLYDKALTSIAMCKLAMKYHDEFAPNGKNPSGKTMEDMLLYVRQKMFVHLRGAKNNKSNSRKKDEDKTLTEEDMPDKWLFNGWFVFVMYGPQGVCATSLSCLSRDGKDVVKVSRAETRDKVAKVEDDKRRADNGTAAGARGVSMQDQITLATLSHCQFREASQNVREHLFLINSQETNTLNALQLTREMLKDADTEAERKYHRKRKLHLLARLEELDERKKELEAEADRLRRAGANTEAGRTTPPQTISVEQSTKTTTSSSLSNSKSSSSNKKRNSSITNESNNRKKKSSDVLFIDDSDDSDDDKIDDNNDDEIDDNNKNDTAGEDDNDTVGEDSPVVPPKVAMKRVCPVQQKLDPKSLAVLEEFRQKAIAEKAKGNQVTDYGMDYLYDY